MLDKGVETLDPPRLSDQLCFAAYAAAHAFGKAYREVLDPLGLTYPQYLVLLVLWEDGEMAVKDIGRRLHLDTGTLTPLLKRMEAAGLVRRKRSLDDERQVRVSVTGKGRDLKKPVADACEHVACTLELPPAKVEALRASLIEIVHSLGRR
ncbi:MarR family winged helix-turn-helix transcriptional regulator [Salinarimonas ramus]|uniref:HTH marR-type domain-containing protein n=1 Tax=Salinarimonas ramus TaxID=690164 RepID=A0A917Q4K6_9HYPH|nr:MarR family transcriptional regulator [Salinarimonas ramus]GGK21030.1 hypothetical protein GCM10011322_04570 [Salinarimonas ramus]